MLFSCTKRGRCCGATPSYAEVYAHLFSRMAGCSAARADERLREDMRLMSARMCVRSRRAALQHMETAARTQSCMEKVSSETIALIRKKRRCDALQCALRLRSLQHKVIAHVWRPRGRLARALAGQATQLTPST